MNTKNNKRRKESVEKIEKAFMELIQTQELKEISVSDIYDLADKLCDKLEKDFATLFTETDTSIRESDGAVRMFTHMKENQLFYKTYFKLDYQEKHKIFTYDTQRAEKDFDNNHIKYHIEFFRNGINAIIKMWLRGGCVESPEEMANIIKEEYKGR